MILHNILNLRGTLYLQVWDNRCDSEEGFAEVPRTVDPSDVQVPVAQGSSKSVWDQRDIIQDFLYVP